MKKTIFILLLLISTFSLAQGTRIIYEYKFASSLEKKDSLEIAGIFNNDVDFQKVKTVHANKQNEINNLLCIAHIGNFTYYVCNIRIVCTIETRI